jgi:hypothetical protein
VEIKEKVLHEICRDSLAILDECFKDLESNSQIMIKARNISRAACDVLQDNTRNQNQIK